MGCLNPTSDPFRTHLDIADPTLGTLLSGGQRASGQGPCSGSVGFANSPQKSPWSRQESKPDIMWKLITRLCSCNRYLLGPLWAPLGPRGLGPCGSLGPCGPPWAFVGRSLVGPPGPLWPSLAPHGPGPNGSPGIYIYIYIYISI